MKEPTVRDIWRSPKQREEWTKCSRQTGPGQREAGAERDSEGGKERESTAKVAGL